MKNIAKNINIPNITEYLMLILGCIIISLSFNLFLFPNKIAAGGLPGLSIILYKISGINNAYIQWGINMPLFFLGILKYGKSFGTRTMIGFFSIPLFILLTQNLGTPNIHLLFASIFGGMGVGIGLGLIFKSNSSIGGFSLVAQLLHDYTKIKISNLMILLNAGVVLLASLTFGFTGTIYAVIAALVTGKSIDAINFITKKRSN